MSTEFSVTSSRSDPYVTLECIDCGTIIDSSEADEHTDMHEAAEQAERSDGLTGLVAWLLANKGGE